MEVFPYVVLILNVDSYFETPHKPHLKLDLLVTHKKTIISFEAIAVENRTNDVLTALFFV